MKKYSFFSILLALGFSACSPEMEVPTPSAGNADFTRFVSIGNSLTAGYADGALYQSGQENAYPNMLAEQMKLVGGASTFKTPFTNSVNGSGSDGSGKRILSYTNPSSCDTVTITLGSVATAGDLSIFASNIASQGPFQNVGVPGAKAIHYAFPGYGNPGNPSGYNPYFARFTSSLNGTIENEALVNNPTFFTYWLGNNDVLLHALSGAETSDNGFGSADMTPEAVFESSINSALAKLDSIGAKGVVANIPDVTSVPYFTTVPWNGLVLDQEQVDALSGLSSFPLQVGANPFLIADGASARQAVAGELILLSGIDKIRCNFHGSVIPIEEIHVITQAELNIINSRVAAFNQILKNKAAEYGFAFCDMNGYMKTFSSGIMYDGVAFDARFISGGAFSLDGVHPNPKGYALIANNFIRTINSFYGASLPPVQVNEYPGIIFP